MSRTILLSNTQISALLKRDKASISRQAARGDFGMSHVDPGQRRKRYALVAIEAAEGCTFTENEIEAARAAHVYTGPTKATLIAELRRLTVLRFIKARDQQWIAALAGQTLVGFTPPPFPTTIEGNPS